MKNKILILFTLIIGSIRGQDIGVVNISSPITGCVLTTNENITIQVFNFGADITVNMGVSYVINGGSAVTEIIPPPLLNGSTYNYTFTTKADLSAPGTYTITAYTTLPGDLNTTNDDFSNYMVNSDPISIGGSVSADATVCSGSNSGTLTLSSNTGSVLNWEYSTNGGGIWTPIANTTSAQTYNNISSTTLYRAVIQSGVCPSINSSIATITTNSVSIGGSISSNTTVCSGTNSGTLTLSGYTGNILNWESSTNSGSTWATIVNTTSNESYNNIISTTLYRASVKNGVCPAVNSFTTTITTDLVSIGGIVASNTTICSGLNTGTLTLSGYTGDILNWESSTNSGGSWSTITNTNDYQTYTDLTVTTWYRVQVKSGTCSATASSIANLTIDPSVVVGGLVLSNTTACSGLNTGTLTLSGYTGSIVNWESSTNNGSSWIPGTNTTSTETYTDLTTTTWYRVQVQNGVCPAVSSAIAEITIIPLPSSGTVEKDTIVCINSNSGALTLSGYTGNILNWESSTNNGLSWSPIVNTANIQNYSNLTTTTWYRAQVQTGICPSAASLAAIITVAPLSEGGTVLSNTTVCQGINTGTLTLSGNMGNILNWESSANNGPPWTNINNTNITQDFANISTETWYRAIVQSGNCPIDSSSAALISFFPHIVDAGNDTTLTFGNSISLNGENGTTYIWSPSESLNNSAIYNPLANPTTTTTYTLSVIDLNGCNDTDRVVVNVVPGEFNYLISNLITCNNDGFNDTWYIEHIDLYPTSEVLIFDANGTEIYKAKPYLNDWAGIYKGKKIADGTYYYILKFSDSEKIYRGSINIVSEK